MYNKIKKVLNRMVLCARRDSNYFELGEFIDMTINRIPYIRLKAKLEDLRKWEMNSLMLADGYSVVDMLMKQYSGKAEIKTENNFERTFLYPVNIIYQLIDFLFSYQNRNRMFRKKVKINLEIDMNQTVCKIFTDINSSDHWFTKKDDEIWNMVRQYTSAINMHSSFVEIERLSYEEKCLVVIKFDMTKYQEEEKEMLELVGNKFKIIDSSKFKKTIYHVLFNVSGEDFIKLVDSRIEANKKNSLYWETKFMNRLRDVKGFPNVKEYMKIGHYELYIADNIEGRSLDEYLLDNNNDMEVSLLFKLFEQIQKLKLNFIVHRDLRGSNIMISSSKDVYVIDFDQASFNMNSSNMVDLSTCEYSKLSPLCTINKTFSQVPKVKDKINKIQMSLSQLWKDAAKSDSNSPGKDVAYYLYSFGDIEFPGERDFFERWVLLEKNGISLKDKVVVELGCNIGLFGAFSALHGAKKVLSFDIDHTIVQCAGKLSKIMELSNIKHEVRDLNVKDAFKDIDKVDFMFAMSVLFWLEDTGEFDRLMKLAEEVLYEGHEHYDCEYNRLREWGFEEIKAIGITDRLRTIFYARK